MGCQDIRGEAIFIKSEAYSSRVFCYRAHVHQICPITYVTTIEKFQMRFLGSLSKGALEHTVKL